MGIAWVFPTPIAVATRIDTRALALGRDEGSDVVLVGHEASRKHALVERDGPLLVVRDLGSRNGTFVNGQRVSSAPLVRNDILRVGEWIGVLVELTSEAATRFELQAVAPGLHAGPQLRAALAHAERAAASELPIVLVGETGTGKEVVAHAIHGWSGRSGPLLAVNCAALPASLAEAELFGHRKGAFTGADVARPGHLRAASGGTLLLDELTDLPLEVQAKLLRALEQREVLPLGESRPVPIDVRVIGACQEPLEAAVADRRFRADLMARMDGVTVTLPPLRERIEDVPLLFDRLLRDGLQGAAKPAIEPALIETLCCYDFPLNVRELVSLVRRLLVLRAGEPTLRRTDLPQRMLAPGQPRASSTRPQPPLAAAPPVGEEARREQQLEALVGALRQHRGNVARAATAIGISRPRAYRLLQGRDDVDLDVLRGADQEGLE